MLCAEQEILVKEAGLTDLLSPSLITSARSFSFIPHGEKNVI